MTIPFRSEAFARGARMLRTALGPSIAAALEDHSVVEVMLNPDGRLWIDRLSGGLEDTGFRIAPMDAERIVRLVAHHVGVEVHAGAPPVSAELPETGERFEGLVPPVVTAPCFAIRRGNRLFELGLSEIALAFTAASSRSDQTAIAKVLSACGPDGFAAGWLRAKGLDWCATHIT